MASGSRSWLATRSSTTAAAAATSDSARRAGAARRGNGNERTLIVYDEGTLEPWHDFGLRLGFAGEDGCQGNRTSENVLVVGNQVVVFSFGESTDVLLYDNRDNECTEDPVGGPFEVSGEAGSRTLLVLYGSPGSMEALTLEI